MNKELKNNLYQNATISITYSLDGTYNNAPGAPVVTETAKALSIYDVNRFNIPSMRPFGFISVPNDYTQQLVANLGVSNNNSVVLGHFDVVSGKPFVVTKGESALYSNNYAQVQHNDSIKYYYPGGIATAISGEDVNQILEDAITYLKNQVQEFMTTMTSIYNSHTHPTGGPNTGIPNQSTPEVDPFPPQLELDLQAVTEGITLINDSGSTPIGG